MTAINGKRWKIAILSFIIIAGVSFLSVKLFGFLNSPMTASENKALDLVRWEFERPSWFLLFNEQVYSQFSGDIQLNETLIIHTYDPDSINGNSPTLDLRLTLSASVADGFVDSVNISYFDSYDLSWIATDRIHSAENVTKTSLADRIRGSEKGFVSLQGINHPQTVYLDLGPLWLLESPRNQTQTLNMIVEVTYFNGTVYKKIAQPFEVRLVSDDDNSFEKASELQLNQTLVDWLGGYDEQDFFKIHLATNNTITVSMTSQLGQDFDLFLYNSNDSFPVRSSITRGDATESIDYITNTTDWYFIKVERNGGDGIYSLNTTVLQP